jgi:hypothetical protein
LCRKKVGKQAADKSAEGSKQPGWTDERLKIRPQDEIVPVFFTKIKKM